MLHPLCLTIMQRPDLVVDHVSAYAALIQQEAVSAGSELLARIVAWALAVLAGSVFLGLAGTALMLGLLQNQFHWVLVAVPSVPLLLAVFAIAQARKPVNGERFPAVKAQFDSDVHALRMAA